MDKIELAHMSWREAKEYFSKKDIVLLPVGSTEQHGPQNPLGTDHLIAYKLALEAGKRTGVIVLPVIPFGVSLHHSKFPGTIWIQEENFINYLRDVIESLRKHGVKKIIVVNGHGGNLASLLILAREFREKGVLIVVYQWWTAISSSERISKTFTPSGRGHAASIETSLNLYLHPELVNMKEAVDEEPKKLPVDGLAYFPEYTHDRTKSGVFGISTTSSKEKGKVVYEESIKKLVELIEKIKHYSIQELENV